MNGLDLLKQLGEELHDVPAIIITGKGERRTRGSRDRIGRVLVHRKAVEGAVLRALLDRA